MAYIHKVGKTSSIVNTFVFATIGLSSRNILNKGTKRVSLKRLSMLCFFVISPPLFSMHYDVFEQEWVYTMQSIVFKRGNNGYKEDSCVPNKRPLLMEPPLYLGDRGRGWHVTRMIDSSAESGRTYPPGRGRCRNMSRGRTLTTRLGHKISPRDHSVWRVLPLYVVTIRAK